MKIPYKKIATATALSLVALKQKTFAASWTINDAINTLSNDAISSAIDFFTSPLGLIIVFSLGIMFVVFIVSVVVYFIKYAKRIQNGWNKKAYRRKK